MILLKSHLQAQMIILIYHVVLFDLCKDAYRDQTLIFAATYVRSIECKQSCDIDHKLFDVLH